MRFTIDDLKKLDPCEGGLAWYEENVKSENFEEVIAQVGEHFLPWAIWLFRALTKEQNKKIALFCAKEVLPKFEAIYPDDFRPRRAIEAVEKSEVTDAIVHDANQAVVETEHIAYISHAVANVAAHAIAQVVTQADAATHIAAFAVFQVAADPLYFRQRILKYAGEVCNE